MNVGGNRLLVARGYLSLSLLPLILPLTASLSLYQFPQKHCPSSYKIPKITPYPHLCQCLSSARDPTLAEG